MAVNSLSPAFIKLGYSSVYGNHTMTFGVNPAVVDGFDTTLLQKDGSPVLWIDGLTPFITAIQGILNTASSISLAELFTQVDENASPVFVTSAVIGVNGTSVLTTVQASQMSLSYRADEGSYGRVVVLDAVLTINTKHYPPYATNTAIADIADAILAPESVLFSRGGGYPITTMRALVKTNDTLRRRYGLNR